MKIIIGSSFWLYGLTVILNHIELSSQSGSPRRLGVGERIPGILARQGLRPGYIPFRKVRCPRPDQVTLESTFRMRNEQGFHVECTPDKILLAIGSLIIGHLMNGRVHPIFGVRCTEVIYDEATDRTLAGVGWLREHVGLYEPVPQELLRSDVIHDFGESNPNNNRGPRRPPGPDVMDVGSDARSLFDSDSDSSSTSSPKGSSSSAPNRSSRPKSPRKE